MTCKVLDSLNSTCTFSHESCWHQEIFELWGGQQAVSSLRGDHRGQRCSTRKLKGLCYRSSKGTLMSHDMTKPIKWLYTQRRLRSAWASPQSDQSLLSAWRKLGSLANHWAHGKDWSGWADAQADLSLRWTHTHFVGFATSWLTFILFWYCKSLYFRMYSILQFRDWKV